MNERISVVLKLRLTLQDCSWCATELTLGLIPSVFHALKPDVAIVTGEGFGNRVLTLGIFRAIDTSTRQQSSYLGDGDAKYLLCQDMIHALF